MGIFILKALQTDHSEKIVRPLQTFLARQTENLCRQKHILEDLAPLQQQWLLKHHPNVFGRIEGVGVAADFYGTAFIGMYACEDL